MGMLVLVRQGDLVPAANAPGDEACAEHQAQNDLEPRKEKQLCGIFHFDSITKPALPTANLA
jgi:hypothetical protein